ncbi:restriction endonuclease subunit S [Corynebacterium ulceribovis]|uniref:restriction endonuclease subunit S n=1 Tax=Corynebacterium ulceribovis TaxID=487732 RepID=UPI00035D5CDA|nr:restriction endonuclease subunit S [Corynebacterium ulceribovis]
METVPLKAFAEVNPTSDGFSAVENGSNVTFLPLETIWPAGGGDFSRVIEYKKKGMSYTSYTRGDVLVPKITPTFEAGRAMLANQGTDVGLASTEVHVVRALPNADARFLCYVLRSQPFLDEGAHNLQGVGNLRRISPQFLGDYPVIHTNRDTQRAIADYLDRETSEIDAMLDKLDGLGRLLEERRKNEIHQALQGSSNSQIDTGFGPFPRIPSHWALASVSSLFKITNGDRGENYPKPSEIQETGIPFINAGDLVNGRVSLDNAKFVSAEKYAKMGGAKLAKGDIIFCLRGSLGKFGIVSFDEGSLASSVCCLTSNGSYLPEMMAYVLSSNIIRDQITFSETGSAQPNLGAEQLGMFKVPLPPLDEQERLVQHLDETTARIDAMLAKTQQLKDLLTERRSALITAAVTGQIEVH